MSEAPIFILSAEDPAAPFLVSILSSLRYQDFEAVQVKYRAMLERAEPRLDIEVADKAIERALEMFHWQREQGLIPPAKRVP